MNVNIESLNSISLTCNGITLHVEQISWSSGKSTFHVYVVGEAQVYHDMCELHNLIEYCDHLVITNTLER